MRSRLCADPAPQRRIDFVFDLLVTVFPLFYSRVMDIDVESAYTARAAEYVSLFDSMDSVHPADRHLVSDWATRLDGPLIDVGCGPGQWTNYLAGLGCDVRGIDLSPMFVAHARNAYPGRSFGVGTMAAIEADTSTVAGVLAWYSMIHQDPCAGPDCLLEFARVIRSGGGLLLGFFEGDAVASFDHAVVTAYRWPVRAMVERVERAGFRVSETYTRTGPGYRPHGAISAIRR